MNKTKEADLRKHRCCFTGHRPERMNEDEDTVKALLDAAIGQAVSDGFTTFISGCARGVDLWAASVVLNKRQDNPNIHLICAVPFRGFEQRWNMEDRELYNYILSNTDLVRYINDYYFPACFQRRNEWMVDHSSRVIAVFNGQKSGTKNTVDYAIMKRVEVYDAKSASCAKCTKYTTQNL